MALLPCHSPLYPIVNNDVAILYGTSRIIKGSLIVFIHVLPLPFDASNSMESEAEECNILPLDDLDDLNILSSPVVSVKITELRMSSTSAARFRELIGEVTTLLGVEASRFA